MRAITVAVLLIFCMGCEHLIVYEDDSSGLAVGKVAARTLLGLSTIGLSEMGMTHLKDRLEQQAYPVTSGSHLPSKGKKQALRFMVTGNHLIATSEVQQMITRSGHDVVEREHIGMIQEEQRLRLLKASDNDADLLHVGKLSGADRVVFVEATVRPARFGISVIPHFNPSSGAHQSTHSKQEPRRCSIGPAVRAQNGETPVFQGRASMY